MKRADVPRICGRAARRPPMKKSWIGARSRANQRYGAERRGTREEGKRSGRAPRVPPRPGGEQDEDQQVGGGPVRASQATSRWPAQAIEA